MLPLHVHFNIDATLRRSTRRSRFLHESATQHCSHQFSVPPSENIPVFICCRSPNGTFIKDANHRLDYYNPIYFDKFAIIHFFLSNIIYKILVFLFIFINCFINIQCLNSTHHIRYILVLVFHTLSGIQSCYGT